MKKMEKTKILSSFLVLVLLLSFVPVAFADTTIYNVGTPENDVDILRVARVGTGSTGADIVVGEEVTSSSVLVGKSFNQIKILLRKEDSSTSVGSVYIGVWDSVNTPTSGNRIKSCGQLAVSGIATSATFYTFTCSSSYTITSGVVIGAYYADNTIASKFGLFTSSKNVAFNSTSTRLSCYSSNDTARACGADTGSANSWIDSTTVDLIMNLTLTDQSTTTFCSKPENVDLLQCFIEANGGALQGFKQNNPFNPIGGSNDLVVQSLGLSNSDIKTNGVGYLILAVALIIVNMLIILLIGVASSRHVALPNPMWLMFIVSLTVITGFVVMGITDVLILIVSIVALVALASPKILGIIQGARGSSGE